MPLDHQRKSINVPLKKNVHKLVSIPGGRMRRMGWEACFFWRARVDLCFWFFLSPFFSRRGEREGREGVVVAPFLLGTC
jgi:hypothetical protein